MKKIVMLVLAIAMLALPVMAGAETITNGIVIYTDSVTLNNKISETDGITKLLIGSPFNANAAINVPAGKEIILEGNGNVTINANQVDLFTANGGKLTLGKNITVNNDDAILYATNGGVITVAGAKLNTNAGGNSLGLAWDGGVINVESGSEIASSNGQTTLQATKQNTTGTVNINGGTVTSTGLSTVVAKNGGTVNISGGTVKCTSQNGAQSGCAVYTKNAGSKIVVTGGTIEAYGDALSAESDASLDVQGGNIISHLNEAIDVDANATVEISGGNISGKTKSVDVKGKLEVSGGTFSDDLVFAYLKPGLTLIKNNGNFVVWNESLVGYDNLPQTGDTENLMMWVALLAMSLAGITYMRRVREN